MGTNGAPSTAMVVSDEARNFSALDEVAGESERRSRDRLIVRRAELDYKQRLARAFAVSGCFADIKGQSHEEALARALVKIELGDSMGFSPAESMTGIDIIQGRVAVGANLRAARMQREGYSWPAMILTDTGCHLPLEHKGKPIMRQKLDANGQLVFNAKDKSPLMEPVVVSFTKADAERAGLASKDNYKKNPRNMYFARAITNAQRWYAPGILGINILSSEEAIDLAPVNAEWQEVEQPQSSEAQGNSLKERLLQQTAGEGPRPVTQDDVDRLLAEKAAKDAAAPEIREYASFEDAPDPFEAHVGMRIKVQGKEFTPNADGSAWREA